MTRYLVQIADPLLTLNPQWPPRVHLVEQRDPGEAGTHWHLLDDPDAPEGLEGKRVAITMRRDGDGNPVIAERHVIMTHLIPPEGGVMPCCGLTPFEVPRSDRMTEDPALVTCGSLVKAE